MTISVYEDYAEIVINSETHGEFKVKVDLDDVDKCKNYRWCVNKYKSNKYDYGKYYIISSNHSLLLHRFIMNAEKGMVVDHIDGDTMNNRKYNLRVCLHKENSRNSKHRKNNSSGYKGVSWFKRTNKWMAHIMVDKKHKTLGYFDNIEDAVNARRIAEKKYFGEYMNEMINDEI